MISLVAYVIYAALPPLAYRFFNARLATWLVLAVGFIVLPPGLVPFTNPLPPWLIVGGALPSSAPPGKAFLVPLVTLFWALVFDQAKRPNLHLADIAIAFFCLWPIGQSALIGTLADPPGVVAAVYLSCVWGLLWALGRLYLTSTEDLLLFARALAFVSLALLPIALIEGIQPARIHEWLIGPYPFATVGRERWLGFRPLGMFEDGNQYALWIACSALCAAWAAMQPRSGKPVRVCAVILAVMTLVSQSAGAIILMLVGLAVLYFSKAASKIFHLTLTAALIVAVLMALHVGGIVDFREIVLGTTPGRISYDWLREIGRGSFAWRFGQDIKTFPAIRDRILPGTAQWDWFRAAGTRPWGLLQLILGQFGLVGLLAVLIAFGEAALRLSSLSFRKPRPAVFALVLLTIAAVDALLNSFPFYPAIVLAGGALSFGKVRAPCPEQDD
jgi:hypothetical protein